MKARIENGNIVIDSVAILLESLSHEEKLGVADLLALESEIIKQVVKS